MQNLEKLLNQFESLLKEINAPILSLLQPGIEKFEGDFIVQKLPNEVKALYKWRNGTTIREGLELGKLWLFNFGIFLPFNISLETYKEAANNVIQWDEYKFPLFVSGGGEFYLVDCNPSSREYGMILYHSIGDIDFDITITKYDSVEAFIKTIHKCYEEKAYNFSDNGAIHFDSKLEHQISVKFNPKSRYWTEL